MDKSYIQALRIKQRKLGKSDEEVERIVNSITGNTPMDEENVPEEPTAPAENVETPEVPETPEEAV
jgi:hypothetical protein